MNERRGSLIGQATWEITRKALHPEIEGKDNFAIAKQHLENGGSILAYADDPSTKAGVPLIGLAIESQLTSIHQLGVFVSRRQVDWRMGYHVPNFAQHIILENLWGKTPGVKMIRIVQEKDRASYPDWVEYNDAAVEEAKDFLKTPGNVFAITPGATRSPVLIEAKPGVAALFRDAKDIALALPIAVPKGTNRVIAGRPFSWADSQEDYKRNPNMRTKDRMLARLAVLFPEEQRGFYTQMAKDFVWPQTA